MRTIDRTSTSAGGGSRLGNNSQCDTYIYKERNDDYPIIANKILARGGQCIRPYLNKPNLKML